MLTYMLVQHTHTTHTCTHTHVHIGACNVDRCGVNGTCYENASNGQFVCVCNPGNWGVQCEYLDSIDPDPCQLHQCNGRGTCSYTQASSNDPSQNSECDCDGDYNPGTFCSTPSGYDTCSPMNYPCGSGSCVVDYSTRLTYVCTCPPSESSVLNVI